MLDRSRKWFPGYQRWIKLSSMKPVYLALVFGALAISSASAEDVGMIQSIDPVGSVVTVKKDQSPAEQKAQGSSFSEGEHILPSLRQTVVLKLKDGSEVTSAPGSDLSVENYMPSQQGSIPHIIMKQGSAHFDVNKTVTGHPTFFIRTNTATMGVRGTEFIVDQRTDGYSVVHTLDGRVSMGKSESDLENPANSVDVKAGRTSYMDSSMAQPAASKVFNRKTYLTQLAKTYPGLMKKVNDSHQRQIEREAAQSGSGSRVRDLQNAEDEKKQAPPKRRPRKKSG